MDQLISAVTESTDVDSGRRRKHIHTVWQKAGFLYVTAGGAY